MSRHSVTMKVNGRERTIEVDSRKLLVDAIREDLGLVGTHVGCEHGVCGTCTVLLNGRSVRSCISFAVQADGGEIRTVEDLANGQTLHPLQDEFWAKQGLQCGYCTPGMLMRAVELLDDNPDPSPEEIREGISGNLCRCTGYQFIVEAVSAAAERMHATESEGTPA